MPPRSSSLLSYSLKVARWCGSRKPLKDVPDFHATPVETLCDETSRSISVHCPCWSCTRSARSCADALGNAPTLQTAVFQAHVTSFLRIVDCVRRVVRIPPHSILARSGSIDPTQEGAIAVREVDIGDRNPFRPPPYQTVLLQKFHLVEEA